MASSDEECGVKDQFRVNKSYAENYNKWRQKEELQRRNYISLFDIRVFCEEFRDADLLPNHVALSKFMQLFNYGLISMHADLHGLQKISRY